MKRSDQMKRERVWFAVGAVMVAVGVAALLAGHADWWLAQLGWARQLSRFAIPISLVAIGIFVIWAGQAGKFDNLRSGVGRGNVLMTSSTDRRLMGVCGGIAQYFSVDSTIIRVITVLLFVASSLVTVIAYVALGLLLPKG